MDSEATLLVTGTTDGPKGESRLSLTLTLTSMAMVPIGSRETIPMMRLIQIRQVEVSRFLNVYSIFGNMERDCRDDWPAESLAWKPLDSDSASRSSLVIKIAQQDRQTDSILATSNLYVLVVRRS